jgi:hypothetical protein
MVCAHECGHEGEERWQVRSKGGLVKCGEGAQRGSNLQTEAIKACGGYVRGDDERGSDSESDSHCWY